jgi:hypothetical protein
MVRDISLIKKGILTNSGFCELKLRERCGIGYSCEIEALIKAHRIGVINKLLSVRKQTSMQIEKLVEKLTKSLMKKSPVLKKGEAYWAIHAWAKALLGTKAPEIKAITCTWNVTVISFKDNDLENWEELGTTPGSVTIPPDYEHNIKLIPGDLDGETFPIWVRHLIRNLKVEGITIKYLDLSKQNEITDENLSLLEQFPQLEWLDLSSAEITSRSLSFLSRLRELKHLYLNNCRWITDTSLRSIRELHNLVDLQLAENSKISNEGLKYLQEMTGLTHLTLRSTGINNTALSHIEKLISLEFLDLSYTEISDSALASLCVLYKLKMLSLEGCRKITDHGMIHLRSVDSLVDLRLADTEITDKGLTHLMHLQNLEKIDIGRCWKVTSGYVNNIRKSRRATKKGKPKILGFP